MLSIVPRVFDADSSPKRIAIYSFFSCAGFLDLGFELALGTPYEIRMANEINPSFRFCYRFAREHLDVPIILPDNFIVSESIQRLVRWGCKPRKKDKDVYERFASLLEADRKASRIIGFIGGPPCPDFSRAGRNAGKNGDVGPLSRQYVRIIRQQQPDFFLFENVKGLFSSDKHNPYFQSLCRDLKKSHFIAARVVNALWYGVPQFRERLIIIGVRKDHIPQGTNRRFDRELGWDDYQPFKHQLNRIQMKWPRTRPFTPDGGQPFMGISGELQQLTVAEWWRRNDVEHHPNQVNQTIPREGTRERYETIPEGNSRGKSYHRLHRGRYAFTACYGHNEVPLHPWLPRRISVAEALATQSLPKDFALPVDIGISALFKAVGNGVPYLMAKGLAEMIAQYLYTHGIAH